MQKNERAAAQRQGEGVIRIEIIRFLSKPIRSITIDAGGWPEVVSHTLRPTPAGGRFRQSVAGGKFLRTVENFQGCIALIPFDGEGEWKSARGQPNGLVNILDWRSGERERRQLVLFRLIRRKGIPPHAPKRRAPVERARYSCLSLETT